MTQLDPYSGFGGVLSVRTASDGGVVAESVTESPKGWLGGAPRIVLFVHGYNNNVREARESFETLTKQLPGRFPKLGWFYWPGDADFGIFDVLDFLSYPTEIPDAKSSAQRLADRLSQLAVETNGVEITLVGHSMGCRLILECLRVFASQPTRRRPIFKSIFLMAAAVPVELVGWDGALGDAARQLVPTGWIFYSADDVVLHFAFPAGQTLAAAMGNEDAVYLEAVGRHGNPPYFFDQPHVNRSGNGHSDYWGDSEVAKLLCADMLVAMPYPIESRALPVYRPVGGRELPKWAIGEDALY